MVLKDPRSEAGQYDVTVQLRYRDRRQLVTLTFTRDSVDLRAPTSVDLQRTDKWHLQGLFTQAMDDSDAVEGSIRLRIGPHDSIAVDDLHVVETDAVKGSVCGDVTFTEDKDAAEKDPAVGGSVGDDAADGDTVDEGGTLDLALKPIGVALGESKHTCEITSPSLSEPLAIDVTVSRQRSLIWIGVLVLVGVSAGYGVRQFLTPLLTRTRAELAIIQIRETIVRALNRTGDATVKANLRKALDILDRVPSGASVDDMEKAATEATAAYNSAVAPAADGAPGAHDVDGRPLERLGERKAQLKRQAVLIEVLRYALLTLVLVLTAYALYADTWVGTWQQMVAVVSWAFALDVTVTAVQGEMTKAAPARV